MRLKILLFLIGICLLSGCGYLKRSWTSMTGDVTFKCVRGITFVQSDSGLTWLPDEQGKPIPCKE